MPLVTDYNQVKDIYQEAEELGVGLPMFCAEDRETLEGILASALKMGEEIGVDNLPITPAWTCRYHGRPQMKLLTACGEPLLGTKLMLSDLELFAGENSPYSKLRIMPHFDHAIPWLDGDVLDGLFDKFASIMFDASEKPLNENIRLTARYVEKVKGRVVAEGAADEIYEADSSAEKNKPTSVEEAERYIAKTGVDIIVPNVGTEHRSTGDKVVYRSDRAREISAAVGKKLCLHGTSSLKEEDLPGLPGDGFIKINIYTTLAVQGGRALARQVLKDIGEMFDETDLRGLVAGGVLGEKAILSNQRPTLNALANPGRRDAWHAAVRDECQRFLRVFNYDMYA